MRRRLVQVGATVLAGALVGAALVALPADDPEGDASAGPVGPALPAGGPPGADPAPPLDAGDPPPEVAPAPIPVDEDWLDAHLRQARATWVEAAEVAAAHADPAVQAQAPAMRALAGAAPEASDELPALPVLIPYLSDELSVWVDLSPAEADFPALAAHMAPLVPDNSLLEASRSPAAVP